MTVFSCGSAAAKYNLYSVNRYKGCITDQSNWSGPFSLVVMRPDFYPGYRVSRQLWLYVYLQVYIISSYYIWCHDQGDYRYVRRAFLNICNKCFIVAWKNVVVRQKSRMYIVCITDKSNRTFSLVVI